MSEIWITYSVKAGGGNQFDRLPDTFYNIAVFDSEIAALRWANRHGCKAVEIIPDETLEDAIKRHQEFNR